MLVVSQLLTIQHHLISNASNEGSTPLIGDHSLLISIFKWSLHWDEGVRFSICNNARDFHVDKYYCSLLH